MMHTYIDKLYSELSASLNLIYLSIYDNDFRFAFPAAFTCVYKYTTFCHHRSMNQGSLYERSWIIVQTVAWNLFLNKAQVWKKWSGDVNGGAIFCGLFSSVPLYLPLPLSLAPLANTGVYLCLRAREIHKKRQREEQTSEARPEQDEDTDGSRWEVLYQSKGK